MADRIIFACMLVLAGVYFWATEQIPSLELGDPLGPKAFPRLLGICLLISAGMLLIEIIKKSKQQPVPQVPVEAGAEPEKQPHYGVVAAVAGWTALYVLAFEPLGYVLASSVYLLVLTAYFNRGRWLMNVLTSVLFSAGSYFAFVHLLGVTLARGILPF